MRRLRLWVRNIFGFSSSETNGFLVLLPLIILILFSQPLYQSLTSGSSEVNSNENAYLDSLLAHWNFNPEEKAPKDNAIELFEFDPNTASREDLVALGLSGYLSDRIINYRKKGGQFRAQNDLLKIYGMDSSQFSILQPYINLPVPERSKNKYASRKLSPNNKKDIIPVDLNSADTTQLRSVRGIGTVLANRILKFRNSLGGFTSINQINEVYGLDTAVVKLINKQFFVRLDFTPYQLDINHASEKELASHPYIRSKLAKTIITYRFQHGSFSEIDDLLKIDLIDQSQLTRMRPYLKIEP